MMSLQNPVTQHSGPSWTLLQFNFAQALTNAGGTIPLVIDPERALYAVLRRQPFADVHAAAGQHLSRALRAAR